ncbi:MAG: ThiF family adenylyltransferase [Sphingobacterium sp.]|uniref:HesA/MoeB/ThiF family protein n=1 Tax=Sphingobacterium sp. JB170 TaxID=1434842 RepID=UPI00097ED86E|nr:HesA/MoeB/ThiF family protein [Sphingobacterium sp. JB170]SJN37212.1 Sulfur carrier protein adenylyltransferase ThiF [Sphingobacterium sp. JB170]
MKLEERYARHYGLRDFGPQAQEKLQRGSILVIGAGGLGCPVLQYLTASGVGKIGIVDNDRISLSNLHRQILYDSTQIGEYKAQVASDRLKLLNPLVNIQTYILYISPENAIELIEGYDIVIDCTDNFSTRYLLSDICMLLDKPLIFGAIFEYEGQVAIFNKADERGNQTTYRDLFPTPPNPLDSPDCNESGVLGVLPGVIGVLQATEALKLLTGVGNPLVNKLMIINIKDYNTVIVDISPKQRVSDSFAPSSLAEFEDFDYAVHCGIKGNNVPSISSQEFLTIQDSSKVLILDVRNTHEFPKLQCKHIQIPLSQLSDSLQQIDKKEIIVVCQEGKRSQAAAQMLTEKLGTSYSIRNLEGGLSAMTL